MLVKFVKMPISGKLTVFFKGRMLMMISIYLFTLYNSRDINTKYKLPRSCLPKFTLAKILYLYTA